MAFHGCNSEETNESFCLKRISVFLQTSEYFLTTQYRDLLFTQLILSQCIYSIIIKAKQKEGRDELGSEDNHLSHAQ
jgi:hypothetical protein